MSLTLTVFVNFQILSTIIHRLSPSLSEWQQLVDNTMVLSETYQQLVENPYQQSISDNELIVDKVVLINKESYRS